MSFSVDFMCFCICHVFFNCATFMLYFLIVYIILASRSIAIAVFISTKNVFFSYIMLKTSVCLHANTTAQLFYDSSAILFAA